MVFKYSRIFCDVERFRDDEKEKMALKGMGVVYTRDLDTLITLSNKKYKRIVLKSYYDKYHNKLDKRVVNGLKKNDNCLIIDLHSFSDMMVNKLFKSKDNPDICLGVDPFFTSKELVDFTFNHFQKYGYRVEINKPYQGTIVPNKFYNKKVRNVFSIMIEINKRVYLDDLKSLVKLKECIDEYYEALKNYA